MLEKWKCGRSGSALGGAAPTVTTIAKAMLFTSLIGVAQAAAAVTAQTDRSSADKSRWIRACKTDIQRYCDEANLKQECLVAHWSKISTECQDVLGSSAGNRAGDGS